MSEITRNQAIQIVEDIRTAISAGSVTNIMEAQVLEYCVSVLGRRIEEASQSEHIENLPDVAAFLAGISPSATLKALLEGITDAVGVINANIGNGYVYAGIATPSGTPVGGKVFYLAKQAGQYANFGGLTVTEGVNILKRNGSTWTQEQLAPELIRSDEMDEVLGGEVAVFLTDSNNNAVLDDNGKPIEII